METYSTPFPGACRTQCIPAWLKSKPEPVQTPDASQEPEGPSAEVEPGDFRREAKSKGTCKFDVQTSHLCRYRVEKKYVFQPPKPLFSLVPKAVLFSHCSPQCGMEKGILHPPFSH
ncbi:unnamed protein product [Lepidochelys kempii]